jgi:hypothetical protein
MREDAKRRFGLGRRHGLRYRGRTRTINGHEPLGLELLKPERLPERQKFFDLSECERHILGCFGLRCGKRLSGC